MNLNTLMHPKGKAINAKTVSRPASEQEFLGLFVSQHTCSRVTHNHFIRSGLSLFWLLPSTGFVSCSFVSCCSCICIICIMFICIMCILSCSLWLNAGSCALSLKDVLCLGGHVGNHASTTHPASTTCAILSGAADHEPQGLRRDLPRHAKGPLALTAAAPASLRALGPKFYGNRA